MSDSPIESDQQMAFGRKRIIFWSGCVSSITQRNDDYYLICGGVRGWRRFYESREIKNQTTLTNDNDAMDRVEEEDSDQEEMKECGDFIH